MLNKNMKVPNPNPNKTNTISLLTLLNYANDSSYPFQQQAIDILNSLRRQGVVSDSEVEKAKKSLKEDPTEKMGEDGVKQDDEILTTKDGQVITKDILNTPEKLSILEKNKNNLNFLPLLQYIDEEHLHKFADSDAPQVRKAVAERISPDKMELFFNETNESVLDVVAERITSIDGEKLLKVNKNVNIEQLEKINKKIGEYNDFIFELQSADGEIKDEQIEKLYKLQGNDFLYAMDSVRDKILDNENFIKNADPKKLASYIEREFINDPSLNPETDIKKELRTNKVRVFRGGDFQDNRGYVSVDKDFASGFGVADEWEIDKDKILDLSNPEHRELIKNSYGIETLAKLSPKGDLPIAGDENTVEFLEKISRKLGFVGSAQSEGEGLPISFDIYDVDNSLEFPTPDLPKRDSIFGKNKEEISEILSNISKTNYDTLLELSNSAIDPENKFFAQNPEVRNSIAKNLKSDDVPMFAEDDNDDVRMTVAKNINPKLAKEYVSGEKNNKIVAEYLKKMKESDLTDDLLYNDDLDIRKEVANIIKTPKLVAEKLQKEVEYDNSSVSIMNTLLSKLEPSQMESVLFPLFQKNDINFELKSALLNKINENKIKDTDFKYYIPFVEHGTDIDIVKSLFKNINKNAADEYLNSDVVNGLMSRLNVSPKDTFDIINAISEKIDADNVYNIVSNNANNLMNEDLSDIILDKAIESKFKKEGKEYLYLDLLNSTAQKIEKNEYETRYDKILDKSETITDSDNRLISYNEAKDIVYQFFSPYEIDVEKSTLLFTKDKAFGSYFNSLIKLVENPDITTPYHETVHAYLDKFYNQDEKDELINYVTNLDEYSDKYEKKYSELDPLEAEEEIADMFYSYMRKKHEPKNVVGRLKDYFDRALNFVKSFVGKEDKINKLFDAIEQKKRHIETKDITSEKSVVSYIQNKLDEIGIIPTQRDEELSKTDIKPKSEWIKLEGNNFDIKLKDSEKSIFSGASRLLNSVSDIVGDEVYLVGGAVRDLLMRNANIIDKDVNDLDFTVPSEDTIKELHSYFKENDEYGMDDSGLPFAHIKVIEKSTGNEYEFTAFRKESYRDTSRDPEISQGTIDDEMQRRDFTINSIFAKLGYNENSINLYLNDKTKDFIDDINNGVLRTYNKPEIIFEDDPLRLLRALRFANRYGFELDSNLKNAIDNFDPALMEKVSGERVRDELMKILKTGDDVFAHKIIAKVFPELEDLYKYPDIIEHINRAIKLSRKYNDDVLLWASLFHDISKPQTAQPGKQFKTIYPSHAENSAEMLKNGIMDRLKFTRTERKVVEKITKIHTKAQQISNMSFNKFVDFAISNKDVFPYLMKFQDIDYYAHEGDFFDKVSENEYYKVLARLTSFYDAYENIPEGERKSWEGPDFKQNLKKYMKKNYNENYNELVDDFLKRKDIRDKYQEFAPAFYSKLEEQIKNIEGNNIKVQRLPNLLKNISKDEIKWSGINEFIKENAVGGKISKESLMNYLKENNTKVKLHFGTTPTIKFNMSEMSEDEILENSAIMNWDHATQTGKLSEDFIRKNHEKLNWDLISAYQKLSEDFIKEFEDKVDWRFILKYQNLSDDFIRKNIDIIPIYYAVAERVLPEDVVIDIVKYPNTYFGNIDTILRNQKLTTNIVDAISNISGYHIDWKSGVSVNKNLSESFVKEYKHILNLREVISNIQMSEDTIDQLLKFQLKHNNSDISSYALTYQKLSEDFIRSLVTDDIKMEHAINGQELSEKFIRDIINTYELSENDWEVISTKQKLSEDFIREFKDKVYWPKIIKHQKLSEKFIEELINDGIIDGYDDFREISKRQNLSEDFIEKYEDKVNWYNISMSQKLSEDFIQKYIYKLDMEFISEYQNLSSNFIKNNIWRLDIPNILRNQNISNAIKKDVVKYAPPRDYINRSTRQKYAQLPIGGQYIESVVASNKANPYVDEDTVHFSEQKDNVSWFLGQKIKLNSTYNNSLFIDEIQSKRHAEALKFGYSDNPIYTEELKEYDERIKGNTDLYKGREIEIQKLKNEHKSNADDIDVISFWLKSEITTDERVNELISDIDHMIHHNMKYSETIISDFLGNMEYKGDELDSKIRKAINNLIDFKRQQVKISNKINDSQKYLDSYKKNISIYEKEKLKYISKLPPSAPFEEYIPITIKNILRYAVENDLDSVLFANAEQIFNKYLQEDRKFSDDSWEVKMYDEKIPNWLNKYIKQMGWDTELTYTDISDKAPKEDKIPYDSYKKQLTLPITQKMKSDILSKGQPLFQKNPYQKVIDKIIESTPKEELYKHYNDTNPYIRSEVVRHIEPSKMSFFLDDDSSLVRDSLYEKAPFDNLSIVFQKDMNNDNLPMLRKRISDEILTGNMNYEKLSMFYATKDPVLKDVINNIDFGDKNSLLDAVDKLNNVNDLMNWERGSDVVDKEPTVLDSNKDLHGNSKEEWMNVLSDEVSDMYDYEKYAYYNGIDPDKLSYLGQGDFGVAYSTGDGRVLKITSSKTEAQIAQENLGKQGHFAQIYDVKQIGNEYYILQEELDIDSKVEDLYYELESLLSNEGLHVQYADHLDLDELREQGMSISEELETFIDGISNINDVYRKLGIEASDIRPENLGYNKNGELVAFDLEDKSNDDYNNVEVEKGYLTPIHKALDEGLFHDAISSGKMTVNDAVDIIKSAKINVPNDIDKMQKESENDKSFNNLINKYMSEISEYGDIDTNIAETNIKNKLEEMGYKSGDDISDDVVKSIIDNDHYISSFKSDYEKNNEMMKSEEISDIPEELKQVHDEYKKSIQDEFNITGEQAEHTMKVVDSVGEGLVRIGIYDSISDYYKSLPVIKSKEKKELIKKTERVLNRNVNEEFAQKSRLFFDESILNDSDESGDEKVLYQRDFNDPNFKKKMEKLGIDDPWLQLVLSKDESLLSKYTTKEKFDEIIKQSAEDLYSDVSNGVFTLNEDSEVISKLIRHDIDALREDGRSISPEQEELMVNDPNQRNHIISSLAKAQQDSLKEWVNYLKNQDDYTDAFKIAILKEITSKNYDASSGKVIKRNNKSVRGITPLNQSALSELSKKDIDPKNILKDYVDEMQRQIEIQLENEKNVKQTSGGKWITYKGKSSDPENFADNANKLAALVQDTPWCTKTNAFSQLVGGDFHVFVTEKDGKQYPRIAVRMNGDSIGEVRGIERGQAIEDEMLDEAENYLKSDIKGGEEWIENVKYNKSIRGLINELEVGDISDDFIDRYEYLKNNSKSREYGEDKINKLNEKLSKNVNLFKMALSKKYKYSTEEILVSSIGKLNVLKDTAQYLEKCKFYYGDMDNRDSLTVFLMANNLEVISGNVSFGGNQSELNKNLKLITGDANFRESNIKDLGKLESIGGNADFRESQIESLGNLTSIGGNADFNISEIKDLGKLESIGGNADFRESQIESLGNLTSIGGNADFRESQIESLGNLTSIGGIAYFYKTKIESLGNLTSIGGDATFRESNIKDLGKLESIGGNADFSGTKIEFSENLTSIGGSVNFRNSQIKDLGKLENIGEDAYFNKTKIESLGNLTSIGGDADFGESQIESLENLTSIGGYAHFNRSEIKDLGNLTSIGGSVDFRNSQIKDLGKLENIGRDAYFNISEIKNLGNLISIGRNAYFNKTKIESLGNLTSIGGDADFGESQIESLENLTSIGGYAHFNRSEIKDLGNLTSIGGDAYFGESQIESLGNLTSIGGDADFRESNIKDLGNLISIGRDAHFNRSEIKDLGNLTSIGGNAYFRESNIKDLGNLISIGRDAYFGESQIESLGNLTSIGGDAYFGESQIESLGNLTSIGGNADFRESNIKDLGNLISIGRDAKFYDFEIESLGNLTSIGGDAYFKNFSVNDFGDLNDIKGACIFENCEIKSLGKLKELGPDVAFYKTSIESFGDVKRILGDLEIAESNIKDLGNIETIGLGGAKTTMYVDQSAFDILIKSDNLKTKFNIIDDEEAKKQNLIKLETIPDPTLFQGEKASIDTQSRVITALSNPDVSTPLHELSHQWLSDIIRASDSGNEMASQIVKDVNEFAGSKEGEKFWKETNEDKEFNPLDYTHIQEIFARGFEKFLYDGKAPTSKLKETFNKFKDWLKGVYTNLINSNININLSDKMKNVYSIIIGKENIKEFSENELTYGNKIDEKLFDESKIYLGITPSTESIKSIKNLLDKANTAKENKDFNKVNENYKKIIEKGKSWFDIKFKNSDEIDYNVNNAMGMFGGYTEPTMDMSVNIFNIDKVDDVFISAVDFAKNFKQSNVHVSQKLSINKNGFFGNEYSDNYGKVNDDGSTYQPNATIFLKEQVPDDKIEEIYKKFDEYGLAGFTISDDRKKLEFYTIDIIGDNENAREKYASFFEGTQKLIQHFQSEGSYADVETGVRKLWNFGNKDWGATREYSEVRSEILPRQKEKRINDFSTKIESHIESGSNTPLKLRWNENTEFNFDFSAGMLDISIESSSNIVGNAYIDADMYKQYLESYQKIEESKSAFNRIKNKPGKELLPAISDVNPGKIYKVTDKKLDNKYIYVHSKDDDSESVVIARLDEKSNIYDISELSYDEWASKFSGIPIKDDESFEYSMDNIVNIDVEHLKSGDIIHNKFISDEPIKVDTISDTVLTYKKGDKTHNIKLETIQKNKTDVKYASAVKQISNSVRNNNKLTDNTISFMVANYGSGAGNISYICKDKNDSGKGIFKPIEKETPESFHSSIPPKRAFVREVFASDINDKFGIDMVPYTAFKELNGMFGSYQNFVKNAKPLGLRYSEELFETVQEIHSRCEKFEKETGIIINAQDFMTPDFNAKRNKEFLVSKVLYSIGNVEKTVLMDEEDFQEQKNKISSFVDNIIEYSVEETDKVARMVVNQVKDVPKLFILDYLMANSDRHLDNVLIDEGGNLHAIDNGMSLPGVGKLTSFRSTMYKTLDDIDVKKDFPEIYKKITNINNLKKLKKMYVDNGIISKFEFNSFLSRISNIVGNSGIITNFTKNHLMLESLESMSSSYYDKEPDDAIADIEYLLEIFG